MRSTFEVVASQLELVGRHGVGLRYSGIDMDDAKVRIMGSDINEPTPRSKARGFRSSGMICDNYRPCCLMYLRTTSSSTLPTVSAKYPSAQKLSPHKNSSSSGCSFLITRLVPPFNVCTTSATLLLGFVWMIRCTWFSKILSSLIHHLFIRHASYNNPFRRATILPRSTRLRYFGTQTKWYCKRCFV
jgi:hypothetical protein